MAVTWRHSIIDLMANPIASLYDGGNEPPSRSRIIPSPFQNGKLNKPLEAIVEIRKQLAKFPNDFEGVTLLASIQAEDMKDLPSAEITFNHFCDSAGCAAETGRRRVDATGGLAFETFPGRGFGAARRWKKSSRNFLKPNWHCRRRNASHISAARKKFCWVAQDRQSVFVPEGVKNVGLLIPCEI